MAWLISAASFTLGTLFLAFAVVVFNRWKKKCTRCCAQTMGEMVELLPQKTRDGFVYRPVFRYSLNGNDFLLNAGGGFQACLSGGETPVYNRAKIPVFYNPEDPADAYVFKGVQNTALLCAFFFIGAMFAMSGIAFLCI